MDKETEEVFKEYDLVSIEELGISREETSFLKESGFIGGKVDGSLVLEDRGVG